jgi:hypothetical protein
VSLSVRASTVAIGALVLAAGGALAFLSSESEVVVTSATRAPATLTPRSSVPTSTPTTPRPTPTSAAFLITVNDAELTKSAAASFPQTVNGVTVSDPQVLIESNRVRLVARAKVLFGTTDFVMTATPTVSNGRLDVRIDSATVAGFSVPSDTRASIQQTVEAALANYVPASVRVTSVSLAPGMLTVQGTQR